MPEQLTVPEQNGAGERQVKVGTVWINTADGDLVAIDSVGENYVRGHWSSGNALNMPIETFLGFFALYGTKMPEPRFPLDSYREAAQYLRRPFTKEAVRWKVQSVYGDKGFQAVAYIDARLVIERLNLVIPHLWSEDYQERADNTAVCRLLVDGIQREDVGKGSGAEAAKAARSDSLKRAAVHFGVGVSIYAIPTADIWREDVERRALYTYKHIDAKNGKPEKHIYRLTPAGHKSLREMYGSWLDLVGIKKFGEPIDHGDVEDSAGEAPEAVGGDAQNEEAASDLAAGAAVPLVDPKADALRMECRTTYGTIKNLPKGKTRLAPAAFESQLQAASTSHDDLAKFRESLTALETELRAGQ